MTIFFIVTFIFFAIANRMYQWIPRQVRISGINKIFGLFTGLLRGIVIVTLLIAIIVALPVLFITS